ncbi:DUF6602 domain-containing protein [Vibrio hepatarius]|uniref:DUF6602 domain-containing protein n=1 Tax=Vibrio hepatarius TaxID=171383 RepID=UPI001C083A77|nr:DUF6602 domain-containing protein [Vibrio hepatarius]MBU2896478.1 hypothetical protein [Vibrio hepatarius]
MESIVEFLARSKAKEFIYKYSDETRKIFVDDGGELFHRSEFGEYRERLLKELLQSFLPNYFGFGEGFIVSKKNERSTQCDVIIYNNVETPRIENDRLRRFYPIETTYGVGEIKSKLNSRSLKSALVKLMEIKKIRSYEPDNLKPINQFTEDLSCEVRFTGFEEDEYRKKSEDILFWNPDFNEFQNIVSFLICESIDCGNKNLLDVVHSSYEASIKGASKKHNFILSIKDGFISYYVGEEKDTLVPYNFPNRGEFAAGYRLVKPTESGDHILAFLSALVDALSKTCIYKFDIISYLGDFKEISAPMR